MARIRTLAALVALAMTAACVPQTVPSAPPPAPPRPQPQPQPAPPPPPPEAPAWIDAPLSPGDWSLQGEEGRIAFFGESGAAALTIGCSAPGTIVVSRPGVAGGFSIRTTLGDRSLPARAGVATLSADDPFLDQLVFSRGRFMVEAPDAPPLIVPAWPEPARVIEGCRG